MNAPTTPPLVFESVRAFLARHAPFSQFDAAAFEFLIPRLKLAYFAQDDVVVDRATSFPPLHIILSGHVASQAAGLDTLPDRVLQPGECFPVGALSAGGLPTRSYVAVDDVFAYQLGVDDFQALRRMSPPFQAFCGEKLSVLTQQSLAELQRHYAQLAADQHTLTRTLVELIRNPPVTCGVDTPLRQALATMRDAGVRSIIVVDEQHAPLGVFTLNDLRDRVVLKDVPLDTPVVRVMTPKPITLACHQTAADAMQAMATGGFNQVVVTEGGKVIGTVFERDLFELQRVSLRQIHDAISSARSIASLKHVAGDIRYLTRNLLAQGASAESLTRTIAALNDALTRQIIALVLQDNDISDIDWCWLALGSEGRGEQTLATDQDNALIFVPPPGDNPVRVRRDLLSFAHEVNTALDALGFPLCKGGIMASNSQWCLTAGEWRGRFTQWLSEPTPAALLNANIFFDIRALYGNAALAEELVSWLHARTQDNKLFLRLMVANALQTEPPLGLIRSFDVDEGAGGEGSLDLKTRGTRLFVDAARVFALGLGIREAGTIDRLRCAGEKLAVDARHVSATVEAFNFLQVLRLRSQDGGPKSTPNRIDPYALNEVDQLMLKEAFRQARKLQQRLKEAYSFSL